MLYLELGGPKHCTARFFCEKEFQQNALFGGPKHCRASFFCEKELELKALPVELGGPKHCCFECNASLEVVSFNL